MEHAMHVLRTNMMTHWIFYLMSNIKSRDRSNIHIPSTISMDIQGSFWVVQHFHDFVASAAHDSVTLWDQLYKDFSLCSFLT